MSSLVEYRTDPQAMMPTLNRAGEGVAMDEDLKEEVERLRAENERLKNQRASRISFKVSEKGAVSVYGLGRFPVTLYKEQWARLLASVDDLRAFIKENDAKLKTKPDPKE
jgi:hypothetical protein